MQPLSDKEQEDALPALVLQVRLPNGDIIPLEVSKSDMISEPLNELKETFACCQYTNGHLESSGVKLVESQPFGKYNLKSNDIIDLVLGPYTSEASLAHIKCMSKVFASPMDTLRVVYSRKNLDFLNPIRIAEEEGKKQYDKEQKMNEAEKKQEREKIDKEELDKYRGWVESKIKKIDENKNSINIEKLGEDLKISEIAKSPFTVDNTPSKCVDSIEYTTFNPPTNQRRMQGDLHYIKIRTLEGKILYVTASVCGFYVNCSNSSSLFPQPLLENGKPTYSQTLLGILMLSSERFRKQWSDIKKFVDTTAESLYFQKQKSPMWASHIESTIPTITATEASLIGTTYCQKALVCYNEEFQVCKEFPTVTGEQRIWRDKIFFKIYSEFSEMATKNAVSIIDGCVQPINPFDSLECHIFVINNILYSYLKDDMNSFEITNKEDDSPYTYLQAKHGLSALNIIHALDISDIHIIPSLIIAYKGHKVLAQAMILNLSNTLYHSSQTFVDFGTTDDGETYKDNEALCKCFSQIAEKLNMEKDIAVDKENKEHILSGPYDIKGLKGIDNRNYILDCNRIYPRDLNFMDDKYSGCLLRSELITQYIQQQSYIYSSKKIEEAKAMQKEVPTTEEAKKKQEEEIATKLEKDMRDFEDIIEKKYKYNVNLHTKAKLKKMPEHENSEQKLKEFASFLKDQVIPKVVDSIFTLEYPPTDSESLTNILHMNGINIRYLGEIIQYCKKVNNNFYFADLVEKECVLRSAKHVFNKYIRASSSLYKADVIAHLLNLIICPPSVQELLNAKKIEFNASFDQETLKNWDDIKAQIEKREDIKETKKSKKNKKEKQSKPESESDVVKKNLISEIKYTQPEWPEVLKYRPEDLWKEITALCEVRYFHKLSEKQEMCCIYKKSGMTISFLRDLCKKLGVVIDSVIHLKFDKQPAVLNYSALPFHKELIVGCEPIVKRIDIGNKEERSLMEEAKKYISNDKAMSLRFDLYHNALKLQAQIYGIFTDNSATCASRIANFFYKYNNVGKAIDLQTLAISISESVSGNDSLNTVAHYITLGLYKYSNDEYIESISIFNRALQLAKLIGATENPLVNAIYINLGAILLDLDKFEEGMQCLKVSLDMTVNLYGHDHMLTARGYELLATAYYNQKEFKKAFEMQEKCHGIVQKFFPKGTVKYELSQKKLSEYLTLVVEEAKTMEQEKVVQAQVKEAKATVAKEGSKRKMVSRRKQTPNILDILEYNYIVEMYIYNTGSRNLKTQQKRSNKKYNLNNDLSFII